MRCPIRRDRIANLGPTWPPGRTRGSHRAGATLILRAGEMDQRKESGTPPGSLARRPRVGFDESRDPGPLHVSVDRRPSCATSGAAVAAACADGPDGAEGGTMLKPSPAHDTERDARGAAITTADWPILRQRTQRRRIAKPVAEAVPNRAETAVPGARSGDQGGPREDPRGSTSPSTGSATSSSTRRSSRWPTAWASTTTSPHRSRWAASTPRPPARSASSS